jgi:biopolymer transport protein ExbB
MNFPDSIETWVRTLTLLPILVCSVVGSALTVAKWLQLHRSRIAGDRLLLQVRTLISAHAYERALAVTRRDRSHAARLIERSLAVAGSPRERLAEHVEQAGRQPAREVDYGLGGVGLIATLGPLLGLFGTVVGIVLIFDRLAGAEGVVSPHQLPGGIGTALYTTVAGLIVGMFVLVSHRLLLALADGAIAQLEAVGQELIDMMEERAS